MSLKTLAVVRQEPRPEKLRKIPLYDQGSKSWACRNGQCLACTKLTCSCGCGHQEKK